MPRPSRAGIGRVASARVAATSPALTRREGPSRANHSESGGDSMSFRLSPVALPALAGCAFLLAALPAAAQSSMGSREFQAAELGELAPDLRAEVMRRTTDGNTPRGVLEVM